MGQIIQLNAKAAPRQPGVSHLRELIDERLADVSRDLAAITGQLNVSLTDLRSIIDGLPDSDHRKALLCECHRIVEVLEYVKGQMSAPDAVTKLPLESNRISL